MYCLSTCSKWELIFHGDCKKFLCANFLCVVFWFPNLCDKDLPTLVLLDDALDFFRKFFGIVHVILQGSELASKGFPRHHLSYSKTQHVQTIGDKHFTYLTLPQTNYCW